MLNSLPTRVISAALLAFAYGAVTAGAQVSAQGGEWAAYGHDQLGSRFSPLTKITRDNVAKLAVAWTYRTGEADVATRQTTKFEATPVMVDGMLYLSTPFGRVIELDPERGTARWTYDAHINRSGNWGDFANRGVSTCVDPRAANDAACRRRIYLCTIDARIISLDART